MISRTATEIRRPAASHPSVPLRTDRNTTPNLKTPSHHKVELFTGNPYRPATPPDCGGPLAANAGSTDGLSGGLRGRSGQNGLALVLSEDEFAEVATYLTLHVEHEDVASADRAAVQGGGLDCQARAAILTGGAYR